MNLSSHGQAKKDHIKKYLACFVYYNWSIGRVVRNKMADIYICTFIKMSLKVVLKALINTKWV